MLKIKVYSTLNRECEIDFPSNNGTRSLFIELIRKKRI